MKRGKVSSLMYSTIEYFLQFAKKFWRINSSIKCFTYAEERLAERSKARVCEILLNSNMLRLTYPVEHAFETAWPLKKYLKKPV